MLVTKGRWPELRIPLWSRTGHLEISLRKQSFFWYQQPHSQQPGKIHEKSRKTNGCQFRKKTKKSKPKPTPVTTVPMNVVTTVHSCRTQQIKLKCTKKHRWKTKYLCTEKQHTHTHT